MPCCRRCASSSSTSIEANFVTPLVVGRRLTINPLLILLSLSFWAWVWGTTGALLAVPLLIIFRTVLDAAGKPDIAGFLFEEGTLIHEHHDDPRGAPSRTAARPAEQYAAARLTGPGGSTTSPACPTRV